jgi:uroporphyrinogen decarboxylase
MNERQRYLEALTFGKPDKIPFEPGWPRESTLSTWRKQGLPDKVDWYDYFHQVLGITRQPSIARLELDVDFRLIPQFEEKILEHRNNHYIVQDWMGAVTEISDQYDYTYIRSAKDFVTRKWHRFPVESREDWVKKICPRYEPNSPGRLPPNFQNRASAWEMRDYPLRVTFNGPFWQMREWCGFEGLCTLMADDPSFVDEMAAFWKHFILVMLRQVLYIVQPDFVMVNEDMAYKEHSMISPKMARRFLLPAWSEWVALLRENGVPLIFIDSDGYAGELLPIWIEAGFNGSYPTEVAAGNDIVAYRRKYGQKMAFIGGIDKRALAAGGESMRQEVLRVVPPLLELGGFIPGCDHGVPPDISWHNFIAYGKLLGGLTGWI